MKNIPFCDFCVANYGGSYEFVETDFGTILRIHAGRDIFKINLTDKTRFGKYTLNHRDFGARLDGKYYFHKQLECRDLSFALYAAWTHDFLKLLGIAYNKEDYKRFMEDYKKYLTALS